VSFVSPSKQQLILDLLLGRVSAQQFYAAYPTSEATASGEGSEMLKRAVEEQDGVAAEFGLYLGHKFGITPEYLEPLNALADAEWHQRHEDAVAGLAKLHHPSSVEPLYGAARLRPQYLDYDETFALAKKAVHALEAIQTTQAVEKLGQLLSQSPDVVKEYAKRALTRIADKGHSEQLRSSAARWLAPS
jgi:hypothetical protein